MLYLIGQLLISISDARNHKQNIKKKLHGSLPANITQRQRRNKGSQTLAGYRIQRSLQCCSWFSRIVFLNLGRQKEEPVPFRMNFQISPKSASAKRLLLAVVSTSFQILLRRVSKVYRLASGQFQWSWTTISVNYKVFFEDLSLSCMHMRSWWRSQQLWRKRLCLLCICWN